MEELQSEMTKKRVKNYDIVVTFNLFLLPLTPNYVIYQSIQ